MKYENVQEMKYSSVINVSSEYEEINMIFIVSREDKDKAMDVLQKAYDAMWDNDDDPDSYGDILTDALSDAGIEYEMYSRTED